MSRCFINYLYFSVKFHDQGPLFLIPYGNLIYFKIWPDLGVFVGLDYRLDRFSNKAQGLAYRVTEEYRYGRYRTPLCMLNWGRALEHLIGSSVF